MSELPRIVGISGTNGAGKDTLGELLAERQNFKFVSVSDILRDELTRQGVPHEREHMRALSTQWAKEHGPGVLSEKTIEVYYEEEERLGYAGLAIGSIRRVAEARAVQQEGGLVFFVDADEFLRYNHIQEGNRGRGATDLLPFDEWSAQQAIELNAPIGDDGTAININGVREVADIQIENNFETVDDYKTYLINKYKL